MNGLDPSTHCSMTAAAKDAASSTLVRLVGKPQRSIESRLADQYPDDYATRMMLSSLRHDLLTYLAGLTLASGVGLAALNDVPADMLVDVLSDVQSLGWDEEERGRVLGILASDERSAVRAAAAEIVLMSPSWHESTLNLLRGLVNDPNRVVRDRATAAFAALLERAPVLRRLEVVAGWATSDNPSERAAAARALALGAAIPAADLVLSHLVSDPVSAIRRTALAAARERLALFPDVLRDVAALSLHDPIRSVRSLARRIYATAAQCT